MISSSLAELRSHLTPDTGISILEKTRISKLANGQAISENGINLKRTSVTLIKVKYLFNLNTNNDNGCQSGAASSSLSSSSPSSSAISNSW